MEQPAAGIVLAVLRLLLVLAAANTAPLVAKAVLGARGAAPLDAGLVFVDGRPLLGPSKTWRGAACGIAAATLAALVLGMGAATGAVLGATAMAGDALASFAKRRLRIAPSGRAWGLDQVPESLLPLLVLQGWRPVGWPVVVAAAVAFLLLEPPLARLWHRLGWRDQPY
jgi:CDP-2,3-bis-(O-geranylgeranyl)-sn-glycerol synthase